MLQQGASKHGGSFLGNRGMIEIWGSPHFRVSTDAQFQVFVGERGGAWVAAGCCCAARLLPGSGWLL